MAVLILFLISGTNNSDLALSMAHKTSERKIKEMVIHQLPRARGRNCQITCPVYINADYPKHGLLTMLLFLRSEVILYSDL